MCTTMLQAILTFESVATLMEIINKITVEQGCQEDFWGPG